MILYVDSSALIKKYVEESGSPAARLLLQEASAIFTSFLTVLEVTSFLERAKREGKLDSPSYRQVGAAVEKDFREGFLNLVQVDQKRIRDATRLIRQRRLRVQDSLQLASAMAMAAEVRGEIVFVCADRALLESARLEGLRCSDVSS